MRCPCGIESESDSDSDSEAIIRIERLILELGWDIPSDLQHSCRRCLDSMTNDITNELDAVQSRAVTQTDTLFQIVSPDSGAYEMTRERFNKSMNYRVIRIERINNPTLRDQFDNHCKTNGIYRWLFHGSNNDNYVSIAKGGFDIKRSKNGLLGIGVYFAENASYSNNYINSLITETDNDPIMNMLLCRVCLTSDDRTNNDIHCIIDDRRAYPEYIIYYKGRE
jgi:hypothetical protein